MKLDNHIVFASPNLKYNFNVQLFEFVLDFCGKLLRDRRGLSMKCKRCSNYTRFFDVCIQSCVILSLISGSFKSNLSRQYYYNFKNPT